MHKILELNAQLGKLEMLKDSLKESLDPAPWAAEPRDERPLAITPAKCSAFLALKEDFLASRESIIERLNIATILEDRPAFMAQSVDLTSRLSALSPASLELLEQETKSFAQALRQLGQENSASTRIVRLSQAGAREMGAIEERAAGLRDADP